MKQLKELPSFVKIIKVFYWNFRETMRRPDFSEAQYHALGALKCIVSYNKYGGYCVPKSSRHRPAAKAILANDVYEPKTIEFIISKYRQGDIIHAGTYFGDFLPALSKHCSIDSKIWAFEPNRENYRCANITLRINDIENVSLLHAGLGERNEILVLKNADDKGRSLGGASKITRGEIARAEGTEVVQVVTIDEIVPADRHVSIIQLDVEGHERPALTGAIKTIIRCRPLLILEVLPNSDLLGSPWFNDNILALGYRFAGTIHDNSVFSCT